jgi:murein tripeptide amidase MpaA
MLLLSASLILILGPASSCAPAPDRDKTPPPETHRPLEGSLSPGLPFDRILFYDELTELLRGWAAARPGIMDLQSIGTSPGGRELWLVTITNKETGPPLEKPAILVDGNIHAVEWTGGVAALNFIRRLLRDYGKDEKVTRLVDTRCVYVLPRLSPDGVEATLRDGLIVRSSLPSRREGPPPGLRWRDIDGDGRIVFMRFRDPNGPWKVSPADPRLLVAREPDEAGGVYWRVLPEGTLEDFDGQTISVGPGLEGVDFGTMFPDDRLTSPVERAEQRSLDRAPEIAAYVEAISKRPNIIAHVTCHSFGGALLMPPVNPGDGMPANDRHVFTTWSAKGSELTGYDAMSYLALRGGQDLEKHISTEIGWLYNVRGIFPFITEFWNPLRAAGIKLEGPMSLWLGGFHAVEDELKLLRWNDQELHGRGFAPWHPFEHPQLGPVEIGGWDKVHYWYNVPFERLENEVAPHADWLIYLALSLPRLEIRSLSAEPAGERLWRVRAVVENTGWLPTNGSQKALDNKVVGDVMAELSLPPDAHVVGGGPLRTIGQLAGRSEQRSTATWWGYEPGTRDRAVLDWTISAPPGAKVSVIVHHDHAGTARGDIRVGTPRLPD